MFIGSFLLNISFLYYFMGGIFVKKKYWCALERFIENNFLLVNYSDYSRMFYEI